MTNENGRGWRNRIVNFGTMRADQFQAHPRNWRIHPPAQRRALATSLSKVGWVGAVLVNRQTGHLLDGHERLWQALEQGDDTPVPYIEVDVSEDEEHLILATLDPIGAMAETDAEMLAGLLAELGDVPEFDDTDISALLADIADQAGVSDRADGDGATAPDEARRTLAERFLVPPFSVLDARQGYWQARKRAWIALGIRSELGRGNENLGMSHPETTSTIDFYSQKRKLEAQLGRELSKDEAAELMAEAGTLGNARAANAQRIRGKRAADNGGAPLPLDRTLQYQETRGTSIFDPVLCELAYRWFCPPQGVVLDPFAGGSVRGIVAALTGRRYVGVELRPEQVAANQEQARALVQDTDIAPRWIVGDSRDLDKLWPDEACDFVFTCPPYFDLEIYSDDPADLSNAGDYTAFMGAYRNIIAAAVRRLRADRFACVVVGDIRDKQGMCRNFVSDTIDAFRSAGMALYNEAILVTSIGSLPIRVGKQFEAARKLGKTHQNVLVFIKGDPRKATAAVGAVEYGELGDMYEADA